MGKSSVRKPPSWHRSLTGRIARDLRPEPHGTDGLSVSAPRASAMALAPVDVIAGRLGRRHLLIPLGSGFLFGEAKRSALHRLRRPLDPDGAIRFRVAQLDAERSHRHWCDADDDVAPSLIGDEVPEKHGRNARVP